MKVFFTGASGMLAAEVIPQLTANGHTVIQTDLRQRLPEIIGLDILDVPQIRALMVKTKPDYVFHFAAETNVDLCEQKPDHAFLTNKTGTENIAKCCREMNIPLVYISTGAVFYGDHDRSKPYTEIDAPRPRNIYGESKLQGEIVVKELLKDYFIVRAGWMVGGWELDKKFVYKIVQQIQDGKTELLAINDIFGTPTFTKDFAKNLLPLIQSRKYGLYHMANKGICSRYDMAVKIVEFMGVQDRVKVTPVPSDRFPTPAPRASEMIQNTKLEQLGLNNMPRWEDSLREYIVSNKDKYVSKMT